MICEECGAAFERRGPKSKRRTCSRSCAAAAAWKNDPGRRIASIKIARRTPESRAMSTAANNLRWSRPGEREKLAEWNRKRWADGRVKRRLSRAISRSWTPERRAQASEIRRLEWAHDAAYRAATVAGIRRSKSSPEARALFSELLRARWQDSVWREKWTEGMRRRMSRPEERARFSALMKRRWEDPAWRERIAAILAAARARGAGSGPRLRKHLQQAAIPKREIEAIIVAAAPVTKRPFSMLAMRGPDPMRALREEQALQAGRGRVVPTMGLRNL